MELLAVQQIVKAVVAPRRGLTRASGLEKEVAGLNSLSWNRFALAAAPSVGSCAVSVFLVLRSDDFNPGLAGVALLCGSLFAFFAYRWIRMRGDLARGEFPEADFRDNPFGILMGRPLFAILWFCFTLVLAFLPLAWWICIQERA